MVATAGPGKQAGVRGAAAMGFRQGQVVQELGWDSDADADLREAIMDTIDADLIFEPLEAVDAVLLWWRDDDGDLGDGLVDAMRDLSASGVIWLLAPKVGRPGYVDPADIGEAAVTAGLVLANPVSVSPTWQAQKVVRPKVGRR